MLWSGALLCISSVLRGWQRNAIVFWRCVSAYDIVMWRLCLLMPASSGRCEGGVALGEMMDIVFHLAVWHYRCLQIWWWGSFASTYNNNLKNWWGYIFCCTLSFPFLFVLAVHWCSLFQPLSRSIAFFQACSNSWQGLSREGNKLSYLDVVWDLRKIHVMPWMETDVNLVLRYLCFSWC